MFKTRVRVCDASEEVINSVIEKEEKDNWLVAEVGTPFEHYGSAGRLVLIKFSKDAMSEGLGKIEEMFAEFD